MTSGARVTVETCGASRFPLGSVVDLCTQARGNRAVKGACSRIHHDAHVAPPNHQIAGLWPLYPNKTIHAGIELKGIGVRIRVAGKCVHFVDQMRTVRPSARLPFALPCGADNGLALSQCYWPRRKCGLLRSRPDRGQRDGGANQPQHSQPELSRHYVQCRRRRSVASSAAA